MRVVRKHPGHVGLVVVYVVCFLLLNLTLWRPHQVLSPSRNIQIAEAQAWWQGRVDLSRPYQDVAQYEGRLYNVFPPLFTLISAVILPWSPGGVPHWLMVALLGLPVPALAYALFRRRTQSVLAAIVLTVAYVLGTSFYPSVRHSLGSGGVYWVNHVLSNIGLLVFLLEYFGRRRVWLMGLALIAGCWSRQLTALYFPAVLWVVWQCGPGAARRWAVLQFSAAVVVAATVPMTLNALKFGHPLQSGYRYIYVGRTDEWAQTAAVGLFSPRYIARNAHCMNLTLPVLDRHRGRLLVKPNAKGTAIWLTSPILLFLPVFCRSVFRDARSRVLLLCSLVVMMAVLMYHATGRAQVGYYRFALDYILVWLALLAPFCDGPVARRGMRRMERVVLSVVDSLVVVERCRSRGEV